MKVFFLFFFLWIFYCIFLFSKFLIFFYLNSGSSLDMEDSSVDGLVQVKNKSDGLKTGRLGPFLGCGGRVGLCSLWVHPEKDLGQMQLGPQASSICFIFRSAHGRFGFWAKGVSGFFGLHSILANVNQNIFGLAQLFYPTYTILKNPIQYYVPGANVASAFTVGDGSFQLWSTFSASSVIRCQRSIYRLRISKILLPLHLVFHMKIY